MTLKGFQEESFVQYKKPCMFLGTSKCDFKCDRECGSHVCQNGELAKAPAFYVPDEELYERYINNPLTSSIAIGGLEPFDTIMEVLLFVDYVRRFEVDISDIVIYTGYTEEELNSKFKDELNKLKTYKNIYLKVGRYIPNQQPRYDEVLGVMLASDNQYGIKL